MSSRGPSLPGPSLPDPEPTGARAYRGPSLSGPEPTEPLKPELLCRQASKYGKGDVKGDKFDELGYIVLPPCLWGPDAGLEPSVLLPPHTELVSIKQNFNTRMGHYGEMASWQMRGGSV